VTHTVDFAAEGIVVRSMEWRCFPVEKSFPTETPDREAPPRYPPHEEGNQVVRLPMEIFFVEIATRFQ